MEPKRFVLLDRDGTVIQERHYLSDPEDVALLEGAAEGLRQMRSLGFGLAIVTNQSGIGRGFFDEKRLAEIHDRMQDLLWQADVTLDGIFYCPHRPDEGCSCRKPEIGLVEQAARALNFLPEESFAIGDKPCDIELGKRVGATSLLVRTGYGARVEAGNQADPDWVVDNLLEAARVVASATHAKPTQNPRKN